MSTQSITLERFPRTGGAVIHAPSDLEAIERARIDAERAAAAEAAYEQRMADLCAALQQIADLAERSRSEAIESVSSSLGVAVATLLPALLEKGFASEIAAATATLIEKGGIANAQLQVTPTDHDLIAETLAGHEPTLPIKVISDATLLPGDAQLRWADGGAEFEHSALVAAATSLLEERLKHHIARKVSDE